MTLNMEKLGSIYGKALHFNFCRLTKIGPLEGEVNIYRICITELRSIHNIKVAKTNINIEVCNLNFDEFLITVFDAVESIPLSNPPVNLEESWSLKNFV